MAQLVGREGDLRVLTDFIQQVPEGSRALVLEGEGGVGKTSLWAEGIRLAGVAGYRVLRSSSAEPEARVPFAVLGDVVEPLLDEGIDGVPAIQRRALEMALLRREPEGPAPGVRVLGLGVISCLRTAAATAPVLLALDDVHWTDPSSAAVLAFAVRRLGTDPVASMLTVRTEAADGPLLQALPDETTHVMRVGPLSPEELRRLLQERLGLRMPPSEAEQLHRSCAGNPFFALELARGVLDRTVRVDAGYLSLPDGLQRLMQDRLANLPEGVRRTLAATAALAAPSRSLLAGLGPSVERHLEVATARGLVVHDGDRVRFTHPLLASACYGALPPRLRPGLHARLADLDVGLEERARHLGLAASGPDEAVAGVLDLAATRAQSRGAAPLAADLALRSLELTPVTDLAARHRRQLRAGGLASEAGDVETAKRLALGLVDDARGAVRARALADLAVLTSGTHGFPASERYYRAALAETGIEPRVRVQVLCDLAWSLDAGVSRGGLAYAEQALALARTLPETEPLVAALATVAELTFWRNGTIRQDLLDEAVTLENGLGSELGAGATLARLLALADRHDEARPLFDQLIGNARRRLDSALAGHLFFRARMEIAAGAWETAAAMCEDGRLSADQSGEPAMSLLFRITRAELAAVRGEDGVREEVVLLSPLAAGAGYRAAVHRLARAAGGYELSVADPAAAWAFVTGHLEGATELGEVLAQLVGSVAVEALAAIGELASAEHWLRMLEARAAVGETGLGLLAARCRGVLQRSQGDHVAAVATLGRAAERPQPPAGVNALEHARTVLELGIAHRSARHKRDARLTLEAAAEEFERLGARRWAELARSEVRRIGGRSAGDGMLSETERLIVTQVLAGHRNREVANALHLSPHTVAWNLSRIYRKLGVASRTELVARLGGRLPD